MSRNGQQRPARPRIELSGGSASPEEAAAIGDSASDLGLSPHVGRVFLVVPAPPDPALPSNVTVTRAMHGEGFAEAVRLLLA